MENKWLATWLLAPLLSPAAMAVEAYSLCWYKPDQDTTPAPAPSRVASIAGRLSIGATVLIGLTVVALTLFMAGAAAAQERSKTLVAVFAHGDDEGPVAPILARYAREGARVHLVIATDGAQGGMHTSIPRGPELARVRSEEVRCAADALGTHPPILLGFPDAQLGNYMDDPARLFRLAERLHDELNQLHPDALITWGPDGATGHPDHRIVSSIVTQLVRAGAHGLPERLFYASIPLEGMRAANPSRAAPAFLIPLPKYFSMRVAFTPADAEAARRSMACHRTQYPDDVLNRIVEAQSRVWNGVLSLAPFVTTDGGTDLFQSR